jgi:hypothetical protein
MSLIPVAEVRLRPSVPPTEPVETVTVRVAPVPVTDVIDAPVRPPPLTRVKLPFVTPITGSENVTRNETLAAVVGVGSTRSMLVIVGGVFSMTSTVVSAAPQLPAASLPWT